MSNECNGLKYIVSKLEETRKLGVTPGKRGRLPVNPEKVQQIDDAIATTNRNSGVSMLQQVNSRSAMLREQLIPRLQEKHCLETTLFMQDGAPPHIAKPVKKLFHDTFRIDGRPPVPEIQL
ncbi:hypothetical protein TNCV_1498601 [Trichonephila clavipes]|nr:hypothetical protein TNCV_1498601 [Trichonephila clavipes]